MAALSRIAAFSPVGNHLVNSGRETLLEAGYEDGNKVDEMLEGSIIRAMGLDHFKHKIEDAEIVIRPFRPGDQLLTESVGVMPEILDIPSADPDDAKIAVSPGLDELSRFQIVQDHETCTVIMAETKKKPKMECTNCKQPATMVCAKCKDLPIRFTVDTKAYYCCKDCQVSDWPQHKHECQNLAQRKALYRAASIFQKVVTVAKTITQGKPISKVDKDGDAIFTVYHGDPGLHEFGHGPFYPIDPAVVGDDPKLVAAIAVAGGLDGVDMIIPQILEPLLDGVSCHTQVFAMGVSVMNTKLVLRVGQPTGEGKNSPYSTVVYRVCLASGETYALLPRGAQYGWHKAIMPWIQFERLHIAWYNFIVTLDEYYEMLTTELQSSGANEARKFAIKKHMNISYRIGYTMENALEDWVEDLDMEMGMFTILRMPPSVFENDEGVLMERVKEATEELVNQMKVERAYMLKSGKMWVA